MRKEQDILNETIPLIKQDEKNRYYFFSKAKDPKWFEALKANDLFNPNSIPEPIKTEKGFTLSFWPQQSYLEHLSRLIHDKQLTDAQVINSFLDVLRKISSTKNNFMLAKALFLSVLRIPPQYLSEEDIATGFKWLIESGSRDTLLEHAVHEGLSILISGVTDNDHDRKIFKKYASGVLTVSEETKRNSKDPVLLFFSNYGLKEFKDKYFNVQKIVNSKPYLLLDVIEIAELELQNILSSTDLDQTTNYWRPAVEEHHQNNYHDSAQSIFVGIISAAGVALLSKNISIPSISFWKESTFFTFNRIYISFAAHFSEEAKREEAAKKIVDVGLISECRHEIFQFLQKQFDQLYDTTKETILNLVSAITSDYADTPELNARYAAWEKLRWLEALANSNNERVIKLRKEQLVLTENKTPDHPDFSSYMGATWVGPTSPKTIEDLSKSSADEILNLLLNFENSNEFGSASTEGLSRVLEEFITRDPIKGATLISNFNKLDAQYISSLLDGYAKAWNDKKYVPLQDIVSNIEVLINSQHFKEKVKQPELRYQWVVSSICRFIEAGTRDDDNSFPIELNKNLYAILASCLEMCPADTKYGTFSDAYTRAINEPRGRIFGALVILTLRRARNVEKDSNSFKDAWNDLRILIEPVLKKQDQHEVSLHALVGAYFRQFQYLSKDWIYQNIDFIAPSIQNSFVLWRSFMDGFSYVTEYSKEMYSILRDKGHLLAYLRYETDSADKNSKLDRLQNRVIELSLVAYVLDHEKINEGIIGSIVENKFSDEWKQVLWSIKSIIGSDPKPEHLQKAKDLISAMLNIRDAETVEADMKEHFQGLGRFLELLNDPSDPLVLRIFKVVSGDKESPWELGDLVEYLHQFKDSHAKIVGELFNVLLSYSETIPSWPPEKIREVCEALVEHSETASMVDICRVYSERSISCEPIRDICAKLS